MNKVILSGNLTRDPEVRYTTTGKAVAKFNIAVNDGYGENKKTYFPSIIVWGKPAEACGKSLHKGSKVGVCGRLTMRSYDDKEGRKVTVTEIVADSFEGVEFMSSKQNAQPSPMESEEIPF